MDHKEYEQTLAALMGEDPTSIKSALQKARKRYSYQQHFTAAEKQAIVKSLTRVKDSLHLPDGHRIVSALKKRILQVELSPKGKQTTPR